MLAWWTEQNSKGINTTDKDVRTLALHVLIGAVFGRSYPFLSIMDPPDPGFTMNYRDALRVVLENFLLVLLLPSIIIYIPFAPKKLAKVAAATSQFRRYMKEMLNKEKQRMSDRESDAGNLMSCLVKASAQERAVKGEDGDPDQSETAAQGLSDSEIIGNLFLYHLAGHETTGNTLSYSILLLAAHPEVQEWVAQEVRYVLRDQGSSETWDYDLFNRFKRCLAVMVSYKICLDTTHRRMFTQDKYPNTPHSWKPSESTLPSGRSRNTPTIANNLSRSTEKRISFRPKRSSS